MSTLRLPSKNPTPDARDVERFAPATPPPVGASFSLAEEAEQSAPEIQVPAHWSKGALLNVRNRGDRYVITLYPEEEDPRHPERMMTFPNSWTTQDFVSRWYSREVADPRAR